MTRVSAIFAVFISALMTICCGVFLSSSAKAEDVIKVGILHSLSGQLSITESALRDVMMMLIDRQNRNGGLLGKQIEPVVLDPASDPEIFATKLQELLGRYEVSVVFGGWTSASRKAMLPILRRDNGLLFYPAQYEGQESERNVFYTGAVPNQQVIPAVDYLMDYDGVEKWYLVGNDYVYPRVTNEIIQAYLARNGVPKEDIEVRFIPFDFADWPGLVREIKHFGRQGSRAAVISTINGDGNLPFYRELAHQGIDGADIPVMAFSVGEKELTGIDSTAIEGHLASWGYFQSVEHPDNAAFLKEWRQFLGDDFRVLNDPIESHYIGFNMWVEGVKKAGTTDVNKVIDALIGITVPNLSGGSVEMQPNHHVTRPAMIGEISNNGQFQIIWKSGNLLEADTWSPYVESSKDMFADWRPPLSCGAFNRKTLQCESIRGSSN